MTSQAPLPEAFAAADNTKLLPPELTSELVRREALAARLHEALQSKRLTLLSAPAGSGKTTAILALKQAYPDLPMAWVSLDSGDQDAAGLTALILAALRQLQPAFGAQTQALLSASDGQGLSPIQLAGALSNDLLAQAPWPLALVLDDLHRIDSAAVYELLDHLLERAPEGLHLAATSRHDPPLRLAQLRLRGQLAEFRQEDLQFTQAQIAELVAGVARYALPAEELALVNERTQGWVAGVKLVALSLRQLSGDAQRTDLLHKLAASQRLLFDYLVEEVLDAAQPEERAFLLQTSLLERLTAPACDALTGRSDSASLLRRLYRQNYFLSLTEGDEQQEAETYHYHPLFAQFLEKQLHHSSEWDAAELHRRAAAAATTREQRIRHWLAAQAWDEAIPAIIEIGQEQCERNYVAPQTMSFLEHIPPQIRGGHYWLDLIKANYARQKGLQQNCIDLSLAALPRAQAAGDTLGVLEATWNMYFFNEDATWGKQIERAMAEHKQVSPARQAHYWIGKTWAHLNKYEWPETQEYFERYLQSIQQADRSVYYAAAQHIGPQMLFVEGGMAKIAEFDGRALRMAGEGGGLLQAGPYIRQGWSAFLRCELDAAEQHAQRASEIIESIGRFAYIDLMLDYLRFNLMLARGEYAELGELVRAEESRMHAVETHRINLPGHLFSLWRSEWAQGQASPRSAQRLIESLDGAEWTLSACEPLVRGWQAFAEGKPAEAEQHLAEAARRQRRTRWVGTWGNAELDLALFYLLSQQPAKALAAWQQAAAGIRRRGMPGEALMCGHRLRPLLELAREKNADADVAAPALAALSAAPAWGPIALPQTGQTLTRREAEVLHLLAQGASNQEIADTLVITRRTAKAHVSSILNKLQASTRSEAIARCHEWALLGNSPP